MVDTRVTMLLEEFTLKISEDDDLRQAVTGWLQDHPLSENLSAVPLKSLVTRLLISDAVKDDEQIATSSTAIATWVRNHQTVENAVSPSDEPTKSLANDDSANQEDKDKKDKSEPKAESLPEELLLGMAALRMPDTAVEQTEVVSMLERAVKVAEANAERELARSLRCQIAKRIAASDPDQARTLLMQALDDVLPASEVEPGNSQDKNKS